MKTRNRVVNRIRRRAPLFAALGDETRLTLLVRLGSGQALSITQLTEGATVSRQAITRHLQVLQAAGLVRDERQGRERRFRIEPKPLQDAREALAVIAQQWDDALGRLKAFVEE